MKKRVLTFRQLKGFEQYLREMERSDATVEKYLRDVRLFVSFAGEEEPSRSLLVRFKEALGERYTVAGAKSMLAALNCFLRFCGFSELCVKRFKMQRAVYCSEEKELTQKEYVRLVETARAEGNGRLALLLQTVCSTGIRVSELPYITVEAARRGEAVVRCKGKTRRVFLLPELRQRLQRYAEERGIGSGSLFLTRGGRPMSRNQVWKEMKALSLRAGVAPGKVFPHNLRHLFARSFYAIERDIAKLADILGHASINTTRIYIVSTGAEHRKKLSRMRLLI